ncbi:MAG: InlB B-repeat-containing protein [Gracilibacteraceae bacterium]|nr:InlB B-repeat-containing protein [Gracilibacteraceae bacterium]
MEGKRVSKFGRRAVWLGVLLGVIAAGWILAGAGPAGAKDPEVVTVTFRDGNGVVKTEYIPHGAAAPNPGPALPLLVEGGEVSYPDDPDNKLTIEAGTLAFLGWYEKDAPDDQPYDFSLPVTGDKTLYAHYRADHLVTYLNGYGEVFLTKLVPDGVKVPLPTEEEMLRFTAPEGRHFAGEWLLPNGPLAAEQKVTGDITLQPSTVTGQHYVFFLSDGTRVPYALVDDGAQALRPPNPTRAGYRFSHWQYNDGGGAKIYNFNTPVTADLTLTALWTPDPGKVPYHIVFWQEKANLPDGANLDDSANYEFFYQYTATEFAGRPVNALGPTGATDSIEALVAPQSAHFPDFSDYHHYSANSTEILGNGNTVVNVYFNRRVYNFYFDLNSANSLNPGAATMTIGGQDYQNTAALNGQYKFRAKYEQHVEDVWPTNDNAVIDSGRSGYSFHGWYVPGDPVPAVSRILVVTNKLLPASGTSTDVLIKADWMTNSMAVNLNYYFETLDGAALTGAMQYKGKYYQKSATYSQNLNAVGTPFVLKEIEGMRGLTARAVNTAQVMPAAGSKLADQYLFYDRKTFRLDFNGMGGAVTPIPGRDYLNIKYESPLKSYMPSAPTRPGYTFAGWYYDAGYYRPFDPEEAVMGNANLALFARWTSTANTVRFFDDLTGARLLASASYGDNSYVADPALYTVGERYAKGVFMGWHIFIGSGLHMPFSYETPVTEDLNIHAAWQPDYYRLTYLRGDADSGDPPRDDSRYARGTEAEVFGGGTLARSGHHFVGWQIVDEIAAKGASAPVYYAGNLITVDRIIELTPCFAPDTLVYTVNYDVNFASVPDYNPFVAEIKQYVPAGDTITLADYMLPDGSIPPGYKFAGWSDAGDGKVQYTARTPFAVTEDGRVFYAVWEEEASYLVTFDLGLYGRSDMQKVYSVTEDTSPAWRGTGASLPLNDPAVNVTPPNVSIVPPDAQTVCVFVGWEPAFEPGGRIYSDRVYTAQYALLPAELLPNFPSGVIPEPPYYIPQPQPQPPAPQQPEREPQPDPPLTQPWLYIRNYQDDAALPERADSTIDVRAVRVEYDGNPHSLTIRPPDGIDIYTIYNDTAKHAYVGGTEPVGRTDVGSLGIMLHFTADGYNSLAAMSYIIITPKELHLSAPTVSIRSSGAVSDWSAYLVAYGEVGNDNFDEGLLDVYTTGSPAQAEAWELALELERPLRFYRPGDPPGTYDYIVDAYNVDPQRWGGANIDKDRNYKTPLTLGALVVRPLIPNGGTGGDFPPMAEPLNPDGSFQPDQPIEPLQPAEPGQPGDTPPLTPQTPTEPGQPRTPAEPSQPAQPAQSDAPNPKTGVAGALSAALLAVVALSLAGRAGRARRWGRGSRVS